MTSEVRFHADEKQGNFRLVCSTADAITVLSPAGIMGIMLRQHHAREFSLMVYIHWLCFNPAMDVVESQRVGEFDEAA